MFINTSSLIIPTKDRLKKIQIFLNSIDKEIPFFNEILIIDSSQENIHNEIIKNLKKYKNVKIIKSKPSSSLQRNIGIEKCNKNNQFIMFCDDDIIFDKNSIKIMDKHIKEFPNYVGYGFNPIEKNKSNFFDNLKKNKIFVKNGIYEDRPGLVCESGWHTKISNVKEDIETKWLSTQACIYRSNYINEKIHFDINLGNYSYLEDLFFSYELSKRGKLIICSKATYTHPYNINRVSFNFGVKEILNRFKFVKKNNLNVKKFYIAAFLKCIGNLNNIFSVKTNSIPKFLGNIAGIILCITKQKK